MYNKIIKAIKKPYKILLYLDNKRIIKLPDYIYLKLRYKDRTNKKLNLKNPQTFNEKLQWLKLYDRNPEYIKMVDKYEAKKYVADIIGEEHIIPTIGIWDKFEDIEFDKLPNQFVLKCTHDSGGLVICKDKGKLNIQDARKKINKSLKRNYYYSGREWPYKNVKPRIIAEKYMENKNGTSINDYKFYCFNGECEYVMVCTERETGYPKFYFFDKSWNLKRNMSNDGMNAPENLDIPKVENLNKMFEYGSKLSEGIPFVRVDLYNIDGKVYFGELTFFPQSGFDTKRKEETDKIFREKLKLY